MFLYVFYDEVSKTSGQPFLSASDERAVQGFFCAISNALNSGGVDGISYDSLCSGIRDSSLYRLASFDPSSMEIKVDGLPRLVARGRGALEYVLEHSKNSEVSDEE